MNHNCTRTSAAERNGRQALGFTLIEVILALAILAGAIAVIGEMIRLGLRNAQEARDLTRAEMVCESVVAQVVSGAMAASAVSNAQWDDDPRWLYSIDMQSTSQTGLVKLQVTVVRDLPPQKHPVQCKLIRWMVDPGIEQADEQQQNQAVQQAASNAASQSSSGASTGTSQ